MEGYPDEPESSRTGIQGIIGALVFYTSGFAKGYKDNNYSLKRKIFIFNFKFK